MLFRPRARLLSVSLSGRLVLNTSNVAPRLLTIVRAIPAIGTLFIVHQLFVLAQQPLLQLIVSLRILATLLSGLLLLLAICIWNTMHLLMIAALVRDMRSNDGVLARCN